MWIHCLCYLANIRPLVVMFLRSQKLYKIFSTGWKINASNPHTIQRSTVYISIYIFLFMSIYIVIYITFFLESINDMKWNTDFALCSILVSIIFPVAGIPPMLKSCQALNQTQCYWVVKEYAFLGIARGTGHGFIEYQRPTAQQRGLHLLCLPFPFLGSAWHSSFFTVGSDLGHSQV